MCGVKETTFKPIPENHEVYQNLYSLYRQLHDAFGVGGQQSDLSNVMKELLAIKDKVST